MIAEHAAGFLPAACRVHDEFVGVDLGTGAGVPGVVLALRRPRSRWLLLDSSERRVDLASAAVRAVGLEDRVEVRHGRAEDLAHDPDWRGQVDLVVARAFGSPAEVAECGLPLVDRAGTMVVSVERAARAVWQRLTATALAPSRFDFRTTREGDFLECGPPRAGAGHFPRRPAARRRSPLF